MEYLAGLFIGLALWSAQIEEIEIIPKVSTIELGQEVELQAKGIYGNTKLDISNIQWQSDKRGEWFYLSDNHIIFIPYEKGIYQIKSRYKKINGYAIVKVK